MRIFYKNAKPMIYTFLPPTTANSRFTEASFLKILMATLQLKLILTQTHLSALSRPNCPRKCETNENNTERYKPSNYRRKFLNVIGPFSTENQHNFAKQKYSFHQRPKVNSQKKEMSQNCANNTRFTYGFLQN